MRRPLIVLTFLGAGLTLAACEVNKSANMAAPTVAGPIAGIEHGMPLLVAPGEGAKIDATTQPIKLRVGNAASNGVRQRFYEFEVATDGAFQKKVFTKSVPEGANGHTEVQLPDSLAAERRYFWRAKVQDGANHGAFAPAVSFLVFEPVVIKAPEPVSPIRNSRIDSNRAVFTFTRPKITGPAKSIRYRLEVAMNSSFSSFLGVLTFEAGSASRPRKTANLALPWNRTIFWRVKAFDAANNQGPWSATQSFRTPDAPTSGGGGGVGDGSACPPSPITQLNILRCERSKYGTPMSKSQLLSLLRTSARKFNQNNLPGGKYGILRKTGGHNCGGYSCDIICVGNGDGQKQYDALLDAEGSATPVWGSPKTKPNIRVDTCYPQ